MAAAIRSVSFGLGLAFIPKPGISDVILSAGEYSWSGTADTRL